MSTELPIVTIEYDISNIQCLNVQKTIDHVPGADVGIPVKQQPNICCKHKAHIGSVFPGAH